MDYLQQKRIINQKIKSLASHLGLNPSAISRDLKHGYDDEFWVNFGIMPDEKMYSIEVISESELKNNELADCYTKIVDSNFYFRWL